MGALHSPPTVSTQASNFFLLNYASHLIEITFECTKESITQFIHANEGMQSTPNPFNQKTVMRNL